MQLDAVSNSGYKNPGSNPFTWNHTVGAGCRLLVALLTTRSASGTGNISTVTFNGVALQKAVESEQDTSMYSEIWYLIDPTSGTHAFSVQTVGSCNNAVGAGLSVLGDIATSPISATNSDKSSSGAPDCTTDTLGGSILADCFYTNLSSAPVVGAGQTQIHVTQCTGGGTDYAGASYKFARGNQRMFWTMTNDGYSHAVACIKGGVNPKVIIV